MHNFMFFKLWAFYHLQGNIKIIAFKIIKRIYPYLDAPMDSVFLETRIFMIQSNDRMGLVEAFQSPNIPCKQNDATFASMFLFCKLWSRTGDNTKNTNVIKTKVKMCSRCRTTKFYLFCYTNTNKYLINDLYKFYIEANIWFESNMLVNDNVPFCYGSIFNVEK